VATSPALVNAEEFWDVLLALIEERSVIPVVGAELLTIEKDGASVPLYRAVAERLLSKYGLASGEGGVALRDYFELSDAIYALLGAGRKVNELYLPAHSILRGLLREHGEPPAALRELAGISHFDLFVTATPDDLLARALNAVRFQNLPQTVEIEYAPKLPTQRSRDIPVFRSEEYTAVFYLFGKADVAPYYAIHDEDALEFCYTLQERRLPERILSELRTRSLLLIGCTFADWLSRFFLRLSNSQRLSSGERTNKEFLIGEEAASDRNFTIFLERFSQATRCYKMDARAFVSELSRRWRELNPAANQATAQLPAVSGHTIFLSYAREDLAAARQLVDELQPIGGDVAWFDKSQIMPGDEWGRQTLAAIKRCKLFLPLISANTEQRTEGYFRREWTEAIERARGIYGRKFIMPVVVDNDYNGDAAGYRLVPDEFLTLHYGHAPGGRLSGHLKAEIGEQLRILQRTRAL
jgi:TIR domain